jgi:hypothetical protein
MTSLIGGAAVVLSIAAAASLPVQQPQEPPPRQDSLSSSAGLVAESVMASWQAHGADDGPIAPRTSVPLVLPSEPSSHGGRITQSAPSDVERPSGLDQDWMLDLLVLWRWPGPAPELTQSGGGDAGPAGPFVHRIVVAGGRELRVVFDPRAGSVAVQDAPPLPLDGANVLMLDVEAQNVRVEGTATVESRYAHLTDPVEMAIARSAEVAAFVRAR